LRLEGHMAIFGANMNKLFNDMRLERGLAQGLSQWEESKSYPQM